MVKMKVNRGELSSHRDNEEESFNSAFKDKKRMGI